MIPRPEEDPVLKSSRREALVVLVVWLAAMSYSVGYCGLYGYGRKLSDVRFVWGVPDWVFYGIIVPWVCCFALSIWFSFVFMKDEDLGVEGDAISEEPRDA